MQNIKITIIMYHRQELQSSMSRNCSLELICSCLEYGLHGDQSRSLESNYISSLEIVQPYN